MGFKTGKLLLFFFMHITIDKVIIVVYCCGTKLNFISFLKLKVNFLVRIFGYNRLQKRRMFSIK